MASYAPSTSPSCARTLLQKSLYITEHDAGFPYVLLPKACKKSMKLGKHL